jgi:hypothetical protein
MIVSSIEEYQGFRGRYMKLECNLARLMLKTGLQKHMILFVLTVYWDFSRVPHNIQLNAILNYLLVARTRFSCKWSVLALEWWILLILHCYVHLRFVCVCGGKMVLYAFVIIFFLNFSP